MGPEAGFEPAPTRLRAECSTAELLRNRARIVELRLKNVKGHDRHNAEGKKTLKNCQFSQVTQSTNCASLAGREVNHRLAYTFIMSERTRP